MTDTTSVERLIYCLHLTASELREFLLERESVYEECMLTEKERAH